MRPYFNSHPISRLGSFRAATEGSLTVFSLFVIILMLIAGGMAVDFMRQEAARARLQSTLDRAILAAASRDQKQPPEEVVKDYFAKAGLSHVEVDVKVQDGLTSRAVLASARTTLDSYFLNFLGIDQLDAPAAGRAEESVSNIEISLVLDVSSSMLSNKKIENLHQAGQTFVDTIFKNAAKGTVSMSVVPYATQVAVGPELLSKFNVTDEHAYSHCVDFKVEDYASAALPTTTLLQRTGHFDPTSSTSQLAPVRFVCRTDEAMKVLPWSDDPEALKTKVKGLVANGWTSIDVGVKWGAALLDPASRPVATALVADKVVGEGMLGRPYDYKPSETIKVIVVMTDGINTNQWYLDDRYKSGLSDVWRDPATGKLSVKGDENGDKDFDGVSGETYFVRTNTGANRWMTQPHGGADAVQLTYPQLWSYVTMEYHAWNHMRAMTGNSVDYDAWTDGYWNNGVFQPGAYSWVGGSGKDARLHTICDAAKSAGIVIYSVGFEVTNASATVMEGCASTPGHFFRVEGANINDAFRAIANDIGKLRLTQ